MFEPVAPALIQDNPQEQAGTTFDTPSFGFSLVNKYVHSPLHNPLLLRKCSHPNPQIVLSVLSWFPRLLHLLRHLWLPVPRLHHHQEWQ